MTEIFAACQGRHKRHPVHKTTSPQRQKLQERHALNARQLQSHAPLTPQAHQHAALRRGHLYRQRRHLPHRNQVGRKSLHPFASEQAHQVPGARERLFGHQLGWHDQLAEGHGLAGGEQAAENDADAQQ